MKHLPFLCLVLIFASVAVVSSLPAAGEALILAEDDFSSSRLAAAWTLLREDEAGWRLANGKLSIRTRGQLWGPGSSQQNVLLYEGLTDSDDAVAAELTVDSGLALTHAYEHGGLIWYFDDDNWVTLTQLNHVRDQTQKIMLVHESGGRGRPQTAKATPYKAEQVELRLERRGSEFTGYFRQPGAGAWQRLGTINFVHSGPSPRFGVVAGQGDESQLHWIEFDDFRVLTLP